VRDGLTQVYLERYLREALDKEILRARRLERPLVLLTIEIDELQAIDSSNWLRNGDDHELMEVAELLRPFIPRDGILARYGDRRFVILLPEHTLETARVVTESVREKVATSPLPIGPGELRATICIGGAERRRHEGSADILERASRALCVAKSRGRNQLECETMESGGGSTAP
jgi:diguanylate cyclase (GGDEF)-like protein